MSFLFVLKTRRDPLMTEVCPCGLLSCILPALCAHMFLLACSYEAPPTAPCFALKVVMNLRFAPHLRAIAQRITGGQRHLRAGPWLLQILTMPRLTDFQ
jgi:hypothetical protein